MSDPLDDVLYFHASYCDRTRGTSWLDALAPRNANCCRKIRIRVRDLPVDAQKAYADLLRVFDRYKGAKA